MEGTERLLGVRSTDHCRDVSLARALGDCRDIDAGTGQCGEELTRHADKARHHLAHGGDDRKSANSGNRGDLMVFQLL